MMDWKSTSILVTGGTGSFGVKFTQLMLEEYHPKKIIVLSRDELKQHEMRVAGLVHPCLRYFIGDVRDKERLRRAMSGVDVVVHAAALKQVPACEYNPNEAVKTNIGGAANVVRAAIDCGVRRTVALSTDKAVNPTNIYGATKLCAEKLFVHGNSYSTRDGARFSCVRYGNVMESRGSVIPIFREQSRRGRITITDRRMTRFWVTLEQGVRFVIASIEQMRGGEVFIPRLPSMRIVDLARVIAPGCEIDYIGIRPGEKLHEVLLSQDEARLALRVDDQYVLKPNLTSWAEQDLYPGGVALEEGFYYASDTNDQWLSSEELARMMD